jgi:hypothetical protein
MSTGEAVRMRSVFLSRGEWAEGGHYRRLYFPCSLQAVSSVERVMTHPLPIPRTVVCRRKIGRE